METSDLPSLDVIQRWMQTVMVHPEGVAAGIESDAAQAEISLTADRIEELIGRSQSQTSLERLAVYSNAYWSRLLEVMIGEYPALVHAIGEEAFVELNSGYLQEHPSGSYTLALLGRSFPEYLAKTRPPRETRPGHEAQPSDEARPPNSSDDAPPDWADFVIDLARLERIYSEVFDGPGIEQQATLPADEVRGLTSEQWLAARLIPAPCLRLATFRFPVQDYATAVRTGLQPDPPSAQATRLAITRRDYIVRRVALGENEFIVLSALVAGRSIGEALESLIAKKTTPSVEAPMTLSSDETSTAASSVATSTDEVHSWFRNWAIAGYFIGLRWD